MEDKGHETTIKSASETPETDGYLSLQTLSEKYGYAKDYIGWLARTGRIQAIRYGKYAKWHVLEESLTNYQTSLVSQRETQPRPDFQKRPIIKSSTSSFQKFPKRTTATPVFLETENPELQLQRRMNAILTLSFVLGGILFFTNFLPAIDFNKVPLVKHYQSTQARLAEASGEARASLASQTRVVWSSIKSWLFPKEESRTYITIEEYKDLQDKIAILESSKQQVVSSADTETKPSPPTIIQKIVQSASLPASASSLTLDTVLTDLAGLEERVNALSSDFTAFQRTIPTSFHFPETNTQGIGPITLNPAHLVSETLSVSGSSTLATLTLSSDFSVDTNVLKVDTTNNRVGINTSSPEVAFEVVGAASVSGAFNVGGTLTVAGNIGIGTTNAPNQLTVVGSGSFTGQLKATRNPTLAHTGTWPSFTNGADATLYINPDAPIADGNVIVYANNGSTKFVVDAEGDIYGRSLILTGTTTQGTTTTQGDLTVEGNTQLGDASGDKIKFVGTILPFTLNTIPLSVKASASQTVDVFRVKDANDATLFTVDQGSGLLTASSGFNFAGGTTASSSYSRIGTATTGHALSQRYDLLLSGLLEVDGNAFLDGKASVSGNFQTSGRFIADTAASHSFAGDLTVSKEFVSSGAASNSFAGSLLVSKGLNVNSYQGGGLSACSTDGKVLRFNSGQFSCGTLADNDIPDTVTASNYLLLAGGTLTGKLFGVNAEFQGTASASYLLTGNTLQVGGFSSVAYSRFGTDTTGYSNFITTTNDLLISGDLEVNASANFDGNLRVGNGSTPALFVQSGNGNVGIGTTGPLRPLDVIGTSGEVIVTFRTPTPGGTGANGGFGGVEFERQSNTVTAGNGISFQFGTSASLTAAKEYAYLGAAIATSTAGIEDGSLIFSTTTAGTTRQERMRIIQTGNVGIGTTNPSTNTLQVTGSAGKTVGGTAWQDLSDARLKNVLGELNGGALDTLMQLRPIKYEWNDLHKQLYGNGTDTVMYGFVAQELMEVVPEFVKEGGDGYLWYNPSGIEAILTAGVQEQQAEIASLSLRVEELESNNITVQSSSFGSLDAIFNAITAKLADWGVTITQTFTRVSNLFAGTLHIEEKICVDDICLEKEKLKALLIQAGATPEPTTSPTPEATPEPLTSAEPTPPTSEVGALTESVGAETTPEPTPEPTPVPEQ